MNSRGMRPAGRLASGLLILMLLALNGQVVRAQESQVTDDQVNAVAKELYCPVCENTPLDVCPTLACADWRALIRTQLAEGRTKEEIKRYFAAQYGDHVLAEPPTQGFDLIVWLLPIGAVLVGGFFFSRYLYRLQGGGAGSPQKRATVTVPAAGGNSSGVATPAQDDYVARIEQELRDSENQ